MLFTLTLRAFLYAKGARKCLYGFAPDPVNKDEKRERGEKGRKCNMEIMQFTDKKLEIMPNFSHNVIPNASKLAKEQ